MREAFRKWRCSVVEIVGDTMHDIIPNYVVSTDFRFAVIF